MLAKASAVPIALGILIIGIAFAATPTSAQGFAQELNSNPESESGNSAAFLTTLTVGIYHVPIDNVSRVARLGFNAIQAWGSDLAQAQEYLNEAKKYNLKVLLEMSSFLRGTMDVSGMERIVVALKADPALLGWYTVDEPTTPEQLRGSIDAYSMIKRVDPNHPIYMVVYPPSRYQEYARATDILAVDPYPIPYVSVKRVSDWVRAGLAAVNYAKPVWMVAQAHDQTAYDPKHEIRGPTPEEERCMVYLGIVNGATGIMYYAWDDGAVGLKHDHKLQGEIAKINAELRAESGFYVSGTRRDIPLSPVDDDVQAAIFTVGAESLLVMVNAGSISRTVTIPFPNSARMGVIEDSGVLVNRRDTVTTLDPLQVVRVRFRDSNE